MGKTKQKRERYQSGSLWEENGKWWTRYTERHADGTSSRPTVCIGTKEQYPTATKAREAKDAIMRKAKQVTVVTRFDYLCDDYLKCGIDHLRGYSVVSRRSIVNTVKRQFGEYRLDYLCTAPGRAKMEDWLNGLSVSAEYRKIVKAILSLVFRHAMKKDFMKGDNPVKLIDSRNAPGKTRKKRPRHIITPEQFAALQQDKELPELCKVVLAVMEMTGVRGCEAMGLSWEHGQPGDAEYRQSDVDFLAEPPKLHIRRSVKEGRYIDDPKTPESVRSLAMPSVLVQILMRWKTSQPILNGWVFGSPQTGRPYMGSHVRRLIKQAAARHGFDYCGFGLHNGRHTFRIAFKDAGASLEEQMRAMGHTNPKTTLDYGRDGDHAKDFAPYVEKVAANVVSILVKKTGASAQTVDESAKTGSGN
jgi:integrase